MFIENKKFRFVGMNMEKVRLKDICEVVSGTTPKTSIEEYWDGDIDWITPAELKEDSYIIEESVRKITELAVNKSALKAFPKGTVILSSRAPIGKVAIAGKEMYCNQGFKNLICSDRVSSFYLYWFLKGKTVLLNSLGRGATFKEISKGIVENIEIPLPSLEVQDEISYRLKKCTDIIRLRKEQLVQLDNLIKSRFVEMFGDPVSNTKRIKTFPMTEVCEIVDGDRGKNYPNQNEFFDDEFCLFLNAKNVTSAGFLFSDTMFITKEKDELLRKGKLQRGDVVLTTRGTIGNLAFYTDEVPFDNMRINSGMVILRMKKTLVEERFFIQQFRMQIDDIKNKIASGSAQPQLPISTMNKIDILIPTMEAQNQYATFVQQVDKLKFDVQKSLDETQMLFDSLMQKYFG
ncbi:restriction endonuclease subunit S [Anaeromicropila herbilytica]|uniref:Type I restriction endonuclease MjaXP subunit S n=1 Tax=Anaeromicropila herbilytica TaxID=2785025 RepID=A0A7R7EN82_9FIRM|nr:restriction endonuclease subunit S [Anaeromicropila herbilytica]BCN31859.1 type I restriction endonuclease MjaXP subunit S [Anaeromicropila herbilytica]